MAKRLGGRIRPNTVPRAAAVSRTWIAAVLAVAAITVAGVDGAATATRVAMYGGALIACGVTLFELLAHDQRGSAAERNRLRAIVLASAAVAAVASLALVLLQIAMASGRGWLGTFDSTAASVVFGSSSHLGAGQRVVGLMLLAYAATRWTERAAAAPLLGAAGVAITLSSFLVGGHAATREPRSVGFVLDLVHTSTASIWAGGLIGVAVVLHHRRPTDAVGAANVVRRFSLAGSGSVSLLVATGLGLSWAELNPSGGVPFNSYGLVLLGKAAIALGALAIGAVNHFVIVPSVEAGSAEGWATLDKTLRIELGAVAALVLLTGMLTGLSP